MNTDVSSMELTNTAHSRGSKCESKSTDWISRNWLRDKRKGDGGFLYSEEETPVVLVDPSRKAEGTRMQLTSRQ
uniref:Uncharacterized protein n=1 Tax=Vespula pensylvanica TaxID=30213 RepID=A0A834JVB3_VESPE|nr:hypothetical protein H0235_016912 [Vespula pensylvanica]